MPFCNLFMGRPSYYYYYYMTLNLTFKMIRVWLLCKNIYARSNKHLYYIRLYFARNRQLRNEQNAKQIHNKREQHKLAITIHIAIGLVLFS